MFQVQVAQQSLEGAVQRYGKSACAQTWQGGGELGSAQNAGEMVLRPLAMGCLLYTSPSPRDS